MTIDFVSLKPAAPFERVEDFFEVRIVMRENCRLERSRAPF